MSETHGDTPARPRGGAPGPRAVDGGPDEREERHVIQVKALVRAFEQAGIPIGTYPDDQPELAEFLYEKGVILTRDEDAERVLRALDRDPADPSNRKAARGSADPVDRPAATDGERRTTTSGDGDGARSDGNGATGDGDQPWRGRAFPGLYPIRLDADADTIATLERLDRILGPGIATPNHVVHVCGKAGCCPATEPLPAGWHPDPPLHADARLGEGVKVCVIDTGLLRDVRDTTAWLTGVTGDEEQPTVGHYTGHGTFVGGVVRAMAPAAEVHVESLLFIGGGLLEDSLAPALGHALDQMPDIISMSAGTRTRHSADLLGLQVFWEQRLSRTKGTVLVCAAGNDGDRGPFYPATFPWTISVGALDVDGSRADYSNHGSWVDVYARGSDVVNAYPTGDYAYVEPPFTGQTTRFLTGLASWSGTSFSTPLVAGLIAARMSWSGESASDAADVLLDLARANGAVLSPGMADPLP